MKLTYHKHIKNQGWFYPMYRLEYNGKVAYTSPSKISEERINAIQSGSTPVLYTWDNRLWFK